MNPETVNLVLELVAVSERLLTAAAKIKAQQNIDDQALLDGAGAENLATREQAQKFLDSLK